MPEPFDATSQIDRATDALNAGRADYALELADEIRRAIGPSADEALIRGIALSQQKQTAAASDAFAEAIRQAPNSHKAHFNAAIHEFNAGNLAGATELARTASTLDPEHGGTRELIERLREAAPSPAAVAPPSLGSLPGAVAPSIAEPQESLKWVGKLGPAWLALALVFFACGFAAMVLQIKMMPSPATGPQISSFSDLIDSAWKNAQANQHHPLYAVTGLLTWISILGTILWTLLDLIRRAGNFVWLVAVIPLTCVGLSWVALPIYLFLGRRPARIDGSGA